MTHEPRVRLNAPPSYKDKKPNYYGSWRAFNGQSGTLIAGCGNSGAWVRFDGQSRHQYEGVPLEYLELL